jgi:hypothetical protein
MRTLASMAALLRLTSSASEHTSSCCDDKVLQLGARHDGNVSAFLLYSSAPGLADQSQRELAMLMLTTVTGGE